MGEDYIDDNLKKEDLNSILDDEINFNLQTKMEEEAYFILKDIISNKERHLCKKNKMFDKNQEIFDKYDENLYNYFLEQPKKKQKLIIKTEKNK